jgi:hypothetical protein
MNTIITLQVATATPLQVRAKTFRIFCVDSMHLAAMERGMTECDQCRKVLPKPSIPKCRHGVYCPSHLSRCCSVCHPTFAAGKIQPEITFNKTRKTYTSVRIDGADTSLSRVRKQASENFDRHQFEIDNTREEFGTVCDMFGYEPNGRNSTGFVIGVLRGSRTPRLRSGTPWWVVNATAFKTFISTQKNPSRAGSVLFLFYRCGLDDGEIASRLRGMSADAVKKYRQRLLHEGMFRFGSEQNAA